MFEKICEFVLGGSFFRLIAFWAGVICPIVLIVVYSLSYLINLYGLWFIIPVWLSGMAYLAYEWRFK